MFVLVKAQRKKLGTVQSSIDICINPHCPGHVDVQLMNDHVSFCGVPLCCSQNDHYVSCPNCHYLAKAEIYEKHRRQMGDIGYTIPKITERPKESAVLETIFESDTASMETKSR